MRRWLLILFFALPMLLSGCDGLFNKHYSYIPPDNAPGRQCAAQCNQGKNSCELICRLKRENCLLLKDSNAVQQYENYKRERVSRGLPVIKHLQDFASGSRCHVKCHCVPAYNTCYAACGGSVIERV